MALAGRQIRQLRALAHHLDATVSIGKSGVVEGTATQAVEALGAHELVKCNVLDSAGLDARDAANQLAEMVGAEVVQVIGHKFTLYRVSSREDAKHIELD